LARLLNSQLEYWGSSAKAYHKALPGSAAEHYLMTERGLSRDSLVFSRLGFVENPASGHERYAGCLSIPYLTKAGVVGIRFRRLGDGTGPKYMSEEGGETRLYNTPDFFRHEKFIALCEGEIDALTAHQAGLPAVAVPGCKAWKPFMARCFDGYEAVFILADTDDKKGDGLKFAETAASQIKTARIVEMKHAGVGMDVNSFVNELGPQALIEKLGVEL
jgi:DNA primase